MERTAIASETNSRTSKRLSIVMEWANTRLNGTPRASIVLDRLARQWAEIVAGNYPATLPAAAARFLDGLDRRAELLIVSGEAPGAVLDPEIRHRLSAWFDLGLHVGRGLEYYPLKNFGAALASGDLLLFIDSDVVPDDGWLAHLLGSFARPEVDVVSGQTYVAPTDLVARAYALGWSYELRDGEGELVQRRKFYGNNVAFRTEVFRQTGFPSIGDRTRGAARLLRRELDRLGIPIWQNRSAAVDHPPPSSFRHMVVRALAHGRDIYLTRSERRSVRGLTESVGAAATRFGRGCMQTFWEGRRVGLKPWEIPAALAILASYYGFFALGGLLTHIHPRAMGRRFRV